MHAIMTETVGHTVARNLKAADVFAQFGIDFCQQNKWTIDKVCQANGIEPGELFELLGSLSDPLPGEQPDFLHMPLPDLCKYIVVNHHQFLYRNVPVIEEHLVQTCKQQAGKYPELMDALEAFKNFEDIMRGHLKMEEREFFPYVRDLVKIRDDEKPFHTSWSKTCREYVDILEDDHQRANAFVRQACQLAHLDDPPADACENYKLFIFKIEELDKDVHIHIVLEDSDLHPRAIELEGQLRSAGKI